MLPNSELLPRNGVISHAKRKIYRSGHHRTRYFESGSGPHLVLFHGGHFGSHDAADCAEDWSLNLEGLAQWFHVIAVDKIGQGFTDNPKTDEDYTMAAVVQHAYNFLKTAG
jgi:2-hydroxy-6-oxonona-2,4-dienedioate hydrolase